MKRYRVGDVLIPIPGICGIEMAGLTATVIEVRKFGYTVQWSDLGSPTSGDCSNLMLRYDPNDLLKEIL